MSTICSLPILTVQPDFAAVINDVRSGLVSSEAFWLSCYKTGEPSVHARVRVALDEDDRELVRLSPDRGDVDIGASDATADARVSTWRARCRTLGINERELILPRQAYAFADPVEARKNPSITTLAVAPTLTHYATGHADGSVSLHATSSLSPSADSQTRFDFTPREYAHTKPHVSSVTSIRFFPSARVLLAASVDFTISVLPAEPPPSPVAGVQRLSPARVLKGHTRAVTSTAIVSRGRNVLSGGRDGCVRLWDVGEGACIRTYIAEGYSPVEAITLGARPAANAGAVNGHGAANGFVNGTNGVETDEREVDTADKLLFAALGDGSFAGYDLRMANAVVRVRPDVRPSVALQAVTYDAERGLVATGDARGVVGVWDVRALVHGLGAVRRNESTITSLAWVPGPGTTPEAELAVGTADGLPYVLCVGADGGAESWGVRGELVGVDCEPVKGIEVVGREVWTAAGDGAVRRYVV